MTTISYKQRMLVHKSNIDKETTNEILTLDRDAKILKKMHNIEKILLSCGAYSEKNMEMQNIKFDNVNVPQWERDIITKGWDAKRKISHRLLRKYKLLIDIVEEGD